MGDDDGNHKGGDEGSDEGGDRHVIGEVFREARNRAVSRQQFSGRPSVSDGSQSVWKSSDGTIRCAMPLREEACALVSKERRTRVVRIVWAVRCNAMMSGALARLLVRMP